MARDAYAHVTVKARRPGVFFKKQCRAEGRRMAVTSSVPEHCQHDIHATFHKHLDGGADARRLRDRADLARLLEQEAKLRASRRLVIHNHRTQHRDKTFRQLTTPGIRRMTLSP